MIVNSVVGRGFGWIVVEDVCIRILGVLILGSVAAVVGSDHSGSGYAQLSSMIEMILLVGARAIIHSNHLSSRRVLMGLLRFVKMWVDNESRDFEETCI